MPTVLIVEDEASVREMVAVILQVEGHTVLTAADGVSALDILAKHHIDVVALDVALPDMRGEDLAQSIRRDHRTAHVGLMVISDTEPEGIPDTASAVLRKPFDFARFVDALEEIAKDRTGPKTPDIGTIIEQRMLTAAFQPIVDLTTGELVGMEGLIRGPEGPMHYPVELFGAAREAGLLHELDCLCRETIIRAAAESPNPVPPLLFVNVEPGTIDLPMTPALTSLLLEKHPFRIVTEFTERALTSRVPALMRQAEEIRGRGNAVALDDLGPYPGTVAMLPLVQPEVIKLDLALVGSQLSDAEAEAAAAAAAYAQRSGAILLAEGISDERQHANAIALGARWGQGWYFGEAVDVTKVRGRRPLAPPPLPVRSSAMLEGGHTPFEVAVGMGERPRCAPATLLSAVRRRIEQDALHAGTVGVVIATTGDVPLSGREAETLREIARGIGVLGILGTGVSAQPVGGAYAVELDAGDPLGRERVLAVLHPSHTVLLVSRTVGSEDGLSDDQEYVLTFDPEIAGRVARALVRRLTPRGA